MPWRRSSIAFLKAFISLLSTSQRACTLERLDGAPKDVTIGNRSTMGMTIELPDWSLNYQVAAFGAYATIFVESIYLILGGFENASLLSISILANASAVLVAGLGGSSSTPFAITRICLTSMFLLWASIPQENGRSDGTYAILCSVAHLVYQLRSRHNGHDSEGFLPQHEKHAKIDEAPLENCMHIPSIDSNDAKNSSRSLRIFFGDSFCLEREMVPITILGTVMVYRVFDFDLGFGLVFAFISACLSSVILLSINHARMRGRRMETRKALQTMACLIVVVEAFCFFFFLAVEIPDIKFSWWRISFGVAWFVHFPMSTFWQSLILRAQVSIPTQDILRRLPVAYPCHTLLLCGLQSERSRYTGASDPRGFRSLCLG